MMHVTISGTLVLAIIMANGIWTSVLPNCINDTKSDRIIFPVDDSDGIIRDWDIIQSTTMASNISKTLNGTTTPSTLDVNRSTSVTVDDLRPTTELPDIDNRILVDSLPVCEPGFQLRAGRCRKPA